MKSKGPCLILLLLVSLLPAVAQNQTINIPQDVVARPRRQAHMTYMQMSIPHDEEYAAAILSNG